jgi:hypothetical protein
VVVSAGRRLVPRAGSGGCSRQWAVAAVGRGPRARRLVLEASVFVPAEAGLHDVAGLVAGARVNVRRSNAE